MGLTYLSAKVKKAGAVCLLNQVLQSQLRLKSLLFFNRPCLKSKENIESKENMGNSHQNAFY